MQKKVWPKKAFQFLMIDFIKNISYILKRMDIDPSVFYYRFSILIGPFLFLLPISKVKEVITWQH